MKRLASILAALAAGAAAGGTVAVAVAVAEDQGYRPGGQGVPAGHMPPPGACRVWYPGRPPGQQPAPADCAQAQYEASRYGGRVIYGGRPEARRWDDDRRGRRADRDRRWERDGDNGWVRVCVERDRRDRCVRSELRRR